MPSNKHIISIFILTAAILTISGCDRKTVFHQYNHASPGGWERSDTLVYNIGKIAAGGDFKEEIGIRLNGTYPFTGICLIVEHTILPANIVTYDTLNCNFTKSHDAYNSNGISYRQFNFHLKDIRLNEDDSLQLKIRHDMMRETLPGIADVGVKITGK